MNKEAEAGGFEPPVRLPVRQFSKLVVSATHPNFQSWRFLADSNRRTRFCRPLTKPLIQGTNVSIFACNRCFSIASAKVQLFSEPASVFNTFFIKSCIFFASASFGRRASSAPTTRARSLVSLYPVDILNNTSYQPNETRQYNDSYYNFLYIHAIVTFLSA